MKRTTWIALASVALVLVSTAASFANEPYLPRSEKGLARLDVNRDGRLRPDELAPRVQKRLALADSNGDGRVTEAEFDALLLARVQKRRATMMLLLDGNRDGAVTIAELDKVIGNMFNAADTDKDGGLSVGELQAFKRPAWRKAYIQVPGAD